MAEDENKHPDAPVVISVDDRDVGVPAAHVTGLQIKTAANIPEDVGLYDHQGQEVADSESIHVHMGEKFNALTAPVTIIVNNRDVEVPAADVTGLQIKQAASVPDDFQLFNHKGETIANEQSVRVHRHEKFTAISGQDVS